ncbi:MAG: sortase [Chloroflexota bacterium]
MKRKLVIIVGMTSPLVLLMLCVAALALVGLGGWLLTGSGDRARIIQIAPIAPLTLPGSDFAKDLSEAAGSPVPPPAAAEAAAVAETQAALLPPPPTPNVEQILGFPLPAGSVNSITQEGVATRLVIPKLNLDAPVVISPIKDQTWQVDHLGQAVGHLEGTAAPGSDSNVVLAGHITLAEGIYGPFAGLGQLAPGDLLIVYYGDQKYDYMVDGYQIVERTAIDVTYPSSTGQVTLITCNNWNKEKNQYEQRLVVKGHLIEG